MLKQAESAIVVGYIAGLYGVKGWLKVFSYTQPKDNILHYSPWLLRQHNVQIEEGHVQGKGIVVKLKGIDDRNTAASLLNAEISVPRACLSSLQSDEYYWIDLIGLQVINQSNQNLGKVTQLFATGANDVVVVQGENQEHLLPFLKWVILDVDLTKGVMQVDWDTDF